MSSMRPSPGSPGFATWWNPWGVTHRWGLSGTPPLDTTDAVLEVAELLWYATDATAPFMSEALKHRKSQKHEAKIWLADEENKKKLPCSCAPNHFRFVMFCVLSIVRYLLFFLWSGCFPPSPIPSHAVVECTFFPPSAQDECQAMIARRGAAKQLPAGGGGIVRVWLCGCNCSKTFHSRHSQTTTLDFLHPRHNDVAKVCSMSVCCQLISAYFSRNPL